jgi:hypothetical protein
VQRTKRFYFSGLEDMNKKAADRISPARKANDALLRSSQ